MRVNMSSVCFLYWSPSALRPPAPGARVSTRNSPTGSNTTPAMLVRRGSPLAVYSMLHQVVLVSNIAKVEFGLVPSPRAVGVSAFDGVDSFDWTLSMMRCFLRFLRRSGIGGALRPSRGESQTAPGLRFSGNERRCTISYPH